MCYYVSLKPFRRYGHTENVFKNVSVHDQSLPKTLIPIIVMVWLSKLTRLVIGIQADKEIYSIFQNNIFKKARTKCTNFHNCMVAGHL